MSNIDLFEDVTESTYARPKQPLWAIDLDKEDNEADILKWLVGELEFIKECDKERQETIKRNINLYKGIQYHAQETRTTAREKNDDKSRVTQRVVANHLYDLTQQKVSTLIKYKPDVAVLPANDEFSDKVAAKMTKYWLDHIWYVNDFEAIKIPGLVRNSRVCGEEYLFITWDPDAGDLHPDYVKAKKKNEKIPLLDETGKQKEDDNGNKVFIDRPVKVGEVDYSPEMALNVFVQKKPGKHNWKDVEFVYRKELMHVDEARALFPKSAEKIKATQSMQVYSFENSELESMNQTVEVYHFYHKSTRFMDKGRYIVFSKDTIFSNKELGYSHGKLPCIPMVDRKRPGELHASSFYQNISSLTGAYNNLGNMLLKAAILAGSPKWMLPAGSADIETLGNDITIVRYKGPVPPQLVTPNPISSSLFEFRKSIKDEFQQISGVFGVSRGEPPPGIKAGVALQFLNEQEQERANEDVLNFNEFIRQVAMMSIAVASDYYDESDGRSIRVMGKNNKWMTMFFDVANLAKDYDIRIQNSSALPQSKAARTQTLLDLAERFPDQVTGDQVLDLLDMAQADKFVDIATTSIKAAEAENEAILDNQPVQEPQDYENHITHWKAHVRAMQEFAFKNNTPPDLQEKMKDHIIATEMLMYAQAMKNPAFAEQLKVLAMYPIFFQPTSVEPPPPAPAPMPGQGAGPFPPEQQLPINPAQGGEQQQPVNLPQPSMEDQMQGTPQNLPAGPVELTGAV